MINVTYRAGLAELTGCAREQFQADSVKEVLSCIKQAHGKKAYQEAKRLLITVDQKSVTLLDNLRTRLPDGCTVDFLTISGGG